MTFSRDHCVKIWFGLGIQWVVVMAFGENYSEICRATHILSAATKKMWPRDCNNNNKMGRAEPDVRPPGAANPSGKSI